MTWSLQEEEVLGRPFRTLAASKGMAVRTSVSEKWRCEATRSLPKCQRRLRRRKSRSTPLATWLRPGFCPPAPLRPALPNSSAKPPWGRARRRDLHPRSPQDRLRYEMPSTNACPNADTRIAEYEASAARECSSRGSYARKPMDCKSDYAAGDSSGAQFAWPCRERLRRSSPLERAGQRSFDG